MKTSIIRGVGTALVVSSVVFGAGVLSAATGLGTMHVVEIINGGTATNADFTVTLRSTNGSNTSSISASGDSITFASLEPGVYSVTQSGPAGYSAVFSGDCRGGSVTVTPNASLTCTITDTFGPVSGGGGGTGGNNGRPPRTPPPTRPTR